MDCLCNVTCTMEQFWDYTGYILGRLFISMGAKGTVEHGLCSLMAGSTNVKHGVMGGRLHGTGIENHLFALCKLSHLAFTFSLSASASAASSASA